MGRTRPPETVHPLAAAELPGWVATMATTFLAERQSERTDKWVRNLERSWKPERVVHARPRRMGGDAAHRGANAHGTGPRRRGRAAHR